MSSPIPLGSTVTYAQWARAGRFGMRVIPVHEARSGDLLLWSRTGNMDQSGGNNGHGVIVDHVLPNGDFATMESWGHHGPGFNVRRRDWPTIAVRIDAITPWHVDRMRELTRKLVAAGVGYYSGPGDNDHDGVQDRADYMGDRNGVDCTGMNWDCWDYAFAFAAHEEDDMFTDDDRLRQLRIEAQLGDLGKPGALQTIHTRVANIESLLSNLAKVGALQTISNVVNRIAAKISA